MIRILVVLGILGMAYYFLAGGADRDGQSLRPEDQYRQQEQKVEALESQIHLQATEQLQSIDAPAPPMPDIPQAPQTPMPEGT